MKPPVIEYRQINPIGTIMKHYLSITELQDELRRAKYDEQYINDQMTRLKEQRRSIREHIDMLLELIYPKSPKTTTKE